MNWKNNIVCLLSLLATNILLAQNNTLPVKEWVNNGKAPFVLYITGDGGLNQFSTSVGANIYNAGYGIAAINAKSYFWSKKTPEQTVADITDYLTKEFNNRQNQQLVLIGYSFGADVMPFIVNRLSAEVKQKLISVVLLSPSASTDFEIHISDIIGGDKKRDMDVIAEINKMQVPKGAILFGSDEDGYPSGTIKIKNVVSEKLQGGHHFDGNAEDIVKTILKYILL